MADDVPFPLQRAHLRIFRCDGKRQASWAGTLSTDHRLNQPPVLVGIVQPLVERETDRLRACGQLRMGIGKSNTLACPREQGKGCKAGIARREERQTYVEPFPAQTG